MIVKEVIIDKITEYALKNSADLFLELQGEYYPFGIVMYSDESIVPYYVEQAEEFPESIKIISDLKSSLNEYLNKYGCLSTAICYLALKKIADLEYDLIILEMIFKGESKKEEFWFIIEPDEENHTFKVHEKIDYGKM